MKPVAVLGAGGWGTALAMVLARNGQRVRLWGHDPGHIAAVQSSRCNELYLPGIQLPEPIELTPDLSDARDCSLAVVVVPSRGLRALGENLAALDFPSNIPLLSCTKGIEFHSGLRMSDVLKECLPQNPVAVLSGPSHAEEVARGIPTAVVIGSGDQELACRLQEMFADPGFRAYTSNDVAGMELGGALKNIYAIAAGVSDGIGLGDNTKSALVTRALHELVRLGVAMGGRRETFHGLSGIGDLMVTCFSRHSRNRGVGQRIGEGETIDAITASMKMVAEGVPTTKSAHECAHRLNVEAPILDQVFALLFEDASPGKAMQELLTRDLRAEVE